MNEIINIARMQFGVTSIYHFLFVPLTLGLSMLIAIMETLYVFKKDEQYKTMTLFWGKLFLINFAMGVATGIVQEFHFGMSWSGFSRFIGDVLGAPLAIEALAAFFTESVLIGIWIFGWDKISKKLHLAVIWLTSVAGWTSAFWILVVNTFMQEPSGYVIRNGRAEMNDFLALITSPHLWLQFPHTLLSGFVTGSIFVVSISAYHLLKKKHIDIFKRSIKIAMTVGVISLVLIIFFGDAHAKYLIKHQPMKMAAAEGLWETQDPAPLAVFAIPNEKTRKNDFEIAIPKGLSFMTYSKFSGEVRGMNALQAEYENKFGPGNYIPPVMTSFISFRLMVGAGMLMLLSLILAIVFYYRGKLENSKPLLKLLVFLLPMPYISNTFGWLLTETGRQPWIVYNVMKVNDAVSKSVSPAVMTASLIGFIALYGILAAVDIYLLYKFAKQGPVEAENTIKKSASKEESLWI